jgi:hypothetical protein
MAPTWIPLCKCMQLYCEPYFSSIERWRHGDHLLLANRIGTIDTAEKIFQEYSQNGETFEFDLVYDHPEVPLLDEVIPTPGKTFNFGGDQTSFAAARSLVPEKIFNRCGLFFQNMLLKPMSGNSDAYLESANNETRKTIIAAIEKLFRLSESAGKCRFVFRNLSENGGQSKFRNYPASALSEAAKSFIEYLLEQTKLEEPNKKRKQPAAVGGNSYKPNQSNPNKKPRLSKPKKAVNDDEDAELESLNGQETAGDDDGEPLEEVDNWVTTHPSVGNQVAAHFTVADETTGKMKKALFKGTVTQYAPPSSARAKDQLYHVEWEDGDEEDYEEKDYQKALALFKENYSFVRSDHPSIGRKVAAYFDVPMSGTKGKKATTVKQLYQGKVTGFCPATNNNGGQDSEDEDLYHITWQDGDEEDYDPKDLELGEALYKENFEKVEDLTGEDEDDHKEKTKKAVEEKPEEVTMEIDEEVEKEIQSILDDERHEQQQKEKEQHHHHGHPMPPVSLEEEMKSIEVPPHHTTPQEVEEQQPAATVESPKKSTRNSSSSQMKSPAIPEEKKDTKKKSNHAKVAVKEEEANEVEEVKEVKSKNTTTKKEKSAPSSGSKKKQKQEPEPQEQEEEESDDWTTDHPSVGGRVASYFPVPGKKKGKKQLFAGEITRYGPETKKGANDQLYHVVWEDGDEEDYEEKEYQEAKKRYDEDYESDKKKNQGGEDVNTSTEKSPTKKPQKTTAASKNNSSSEKKSSEDDQEVEILTVHQPKEDKEQQEEQEEQKEEEPVHSSTAHNNIDHENHHHHHQHHNSNNKHHEANLENLETVPIGFNEMEENPMKAVEEQEEDNLKNTHKHDSHGHSHTQNNTQHNISLIDTLPFGADEGLVDDSTNNLISNSQVSQLQD